MYDPTLTKRIGQSGKSFKKMTHSKRYLPETLKILPESVAM
jgi:hypothetical protein